MHSDHYSQPHVESKFEGSIKNETSIHITMEIKNESIHQITGSLGNLKEDLDDELKAGPEKILLEKELAKATKALESVGQTASPEEIKKNPKAMQRLHKFIKKMDNGNSRIGKAIKTVEDGVGYAQDIAEQYNKIAEWCGIPVVPRLFLKSKK